MNVETVEVQVPFQTQLCLKWLLGLVLLQILQHGVFHTFQTHKNWWISGMPNLSQLEIHHFSIRIIFPPLRCEQRCSVSEMTMRVGKVLHLGGLDPVVICLSKYHRHPLLLHGSFKYILLVVYHHNIYSMAISGS